MTRIFLVFLLILASRAACADHVQVSYRVIGLFRPDRVEDLRATVDTLANGEGDASFDVKLVAVNYESAVATFTYNADSKQFMGKKPEQALEQIDRQLRSASQNTFSLSPPDKLLPEQLKQEKIAVVQRIPGNCATGRC